MRIAGTEAKTGALDISFVDRNILMSALTFLSLHMSDRLYVSYCSGPTSHEERIQLYDNVSALQKRIQKVRIKK